MHCLLTQTLSRVEQKWGQGHLTLQFLSIKWSTQSFWLNFHCIIFFIKIEQSTCSNQLNSTGACVILNTACNKHRSGFSFEGISADENFTGHFFTRLHWKQMVRWPLNFFFTLICGIHTGWPWRIILSVWRLWRHHWIFNAGEQWCDRAIVGI